MDVGERHNGDIRRAAHGYEPTLMSALGPGCVKTHT